MQAGGQFISTSNIDDSDSCQKLLKDTMNKSQEIIERIRGEKLIIIIIIIVVP
jgi:hypothetical protein